MCQSSEIFCPQSHVALGILLLNLAHQAIPWLKLLTATTKTSETGHEGESACQYSEDIRPQLHPLGAFGILLLYLVYHHKCNNQTSTYPSTKIRRAQDALEAAGLKEIRCAQGREVSQTGAQQLQ